MVPGNPTRESGEPLASGRGMESDDDLDVQVLGGAGATNAAPANDNNTAGDLGDRAAQAAGTVKQTVNQAAGNVQQQATEQLEGRKGQAVSNLDQVSQALQQVGGQLRQNDQAQLGQVAELAASQVGRLSGYLRNRRVGDLIDDVQDFGRRQPELMLAGAFLLGVVGARFLKASARQANSSSMPDTELRSRTFDRGVNTTPPPMGRQPVNYGVFDPGSAGIVVRDIPQ